MDVAHSNPEHISMEQPNAQYESAKDSPHLTHPLQYDRPNEDEHVSGPSGTATSKKRKISKHFKNWRGNSRGSAKL